MTCMDRNEMEQCLRKDGGIAGQSLRAFNPPRDTPWWMWTTEQRFGQLNELVKQSGCGSRPSAILDALDLYSALLKREPLPDWVKIVDGHIV